MVKVREFKRKQWQNGKHVTVAAHFRTDRSKKTSRKGEHIDMTEDISILVRNAFVFIERGRDLVNKGWDMINAIPKRVP